MQTRDKLHIESTSLGEQQLPNKQTIKTFLYFTSLLILSFVSISTAVDYQHVLVINSYDHEYTWTREELHGIREYFANNDTVQLSSEFMDTKRVFYPEYIDNVESLITEKYKNTDVDLIITTDDHAFDFAYDRCERIFHKKIPIVFCGVNDLDIKRLESYPEITGIMELCDYKGTVDFCRKIHPEITNFIMLADTTKTGEKLLQTAKDQLRGYENATFEYLLSPSLQEIETRLANAAKNEALIYLMYLKPGNSPLINMETSAAYLVEKSPIPIYTAWNFHMGTGFEGGMLIRGHDQGQTAAMLAHKILHGTKASDIPIIKHSKIVPTLDYNVIKKYNLNLDSLDNDIVVINLPPSIYTIYKEMVWTVIAILILLIIAVLVLIAKMTLDAKTTKLIKLSEKRYRSLSDNLYEGIWLFNTQGLTTYVNPRLSQIIGYPIEEIMNRPFVDFIKPELRADIPNKIQNRLNGIKEDYQTIIITKDSKEMTAWINASPVNDVYGKLEGFLLAVSDITEKVNAEKEREKLLKNISNQKEELESLIYAASHDLSSPVVNIQGFTQELVFNCNKIKSLLTESDYSENTSDDILNLIKNDITQSIDYIQTNASKMDTLLKGLIQVSRFDRKILNTQTLSSTPIVNSVIDSFSSKIKELNAEILIDSLPDCTVDKEDLAQIFSSLLSNSLNYVSTDREPIIKIKGHEEFDHVTFSVEDNGIGINPEYFAKVFELFHRLNPANESAPGEGVGLTLAHRAVLRNNGKIWIDSKPDHGATFYFTLPK